MNKTKKRALYILAALLAFVFVLACVAGFAACGGEDEHVHTWDNGVVTKEADCGNAGVTTYTCTGCGETKTETIPATGNHTVVYTPTKAADCVTDGEESGTCSVCHQTVTRTIPKLSENGEHTWGEGQQVKAATCTEDGETTYTCERCNAEKTETIPANGGHELVGTYTGGNWSYTCSVCNESIELGENTLVKSLTLDATDEDSFEAAGLWGEVSLGGVTPLIDVKAPDGSNAISISSSNNHIGGGDTPMDKDVVLHSNIEMATNKVLIVRCTCTLDLNGYSISLGASCTSEYGVIQVGATNVYC